MASQTPNISDLVVAAYLEKNAPKTIVTSFKKSKGIKQDKLDEYNHFQAMVELATALPDTGAAPKAAVKKFEDEELNRLVPIRNVFSDKVAMLEDLKREFSGTELVKVAKFILDVNVKIKNSIALTISAFSDTKSKKRFPYLKTTQLLLWKPVKGCLSCPNQKGTRPTNATHLS